MACKYFHAKCLELVLDVLQPQCNFYIMDTFPKQAPDAALQDNVVSNFTHYG